VSGVGFRERRHGSHLYHDFQVLRLRRCCEDVLRMLVMARTELVNDLTKLVTKMEKQLT
jgi:hypothetical protein